MARVRPLLRSAMTSLEPLTDGETGIQTVIARIDRGDSDRDRDQIMALDRRATQVAEEIERYEPGKLPEQWRRYLSEMRLSAVLLAQATSENDRSSMLSAARRLNATCLGCHSVLRDAANRSSIGSFGPRRNIPAASDNHGSPVDFPGDHLGALGIDSKQMVQEKLR